jgi:hypothetical protein
VAAGRGDGAAFVTQGVVGVEAFPGLVGNAVDGDLNTTTFVGQTQGASGRMSITVAFPPVPEPGTALLILAGLAALGSRRLSRPRGAQA